MILIMQNKKVRIVPINDDYSYSYHGEFSAIIMNKNGYIRANKICNDANKQFKNWKRNSMTKELLVEFSISTGIPDNELMETISSGQRTEIRGTYVHPKLIIPIALWCGPSFVVKVIEWIEEWTKISNENERCFYDALSHIKMWKHATKEKEIQEMLHKKLGGEIEVKTIAGRIDLLTDKYLIEIKNYCDWKCAIGQLIAYSRKYKDRKKIMYLFDVPKKNIMSEIIETCAECDIRVKIID